MSWNFATEIAMRSFLSSAHLCYYGICYSGIDSKRRSTFTLTTGILVHFARFKLYPAQFAKMPRAVRGKPAELPLAMRSPNDQSLEQGS